MTHAEKLAEIARIGNYLNPPPDQAATRGDLLLRDADVAGRREADPMQAGSVCVPAPGRRAPGCEARRVSLDWYGVAFLVTCAFSAGIVVGATMWLLAGWLW